MSERQLMDAAQSLDKGWVRPPDKLKTCGAIGKILQLSGDLDHKVLRQGLPRWLVGMRRRARRRHDVGFCCGRLGNARTGRSLRRRVGRRTTWPFILRFRGPSRLVRKVRGWVQGLSWRWRRRCC